MKLDRAVTWSNTKAPIVAYLIEKMHNNPQFLHCNFQLMVPYFMKLACYHRVLISYYGQFDLNLLEYSNILDNTMYKNDFEIAISTSSSDAILYIIKVWTALNKIKKDKNRRTNTTIKEMKKEYALYIFEYICKSANFEILDDEIYESKKRIE